MTTQLDLFATPLPDPVRLPIRGRTFDAALDRDRLGAQARRVFDVMAGGAWLTLRELSERAMAPEASASARLRDLRKAGLTVERRRHPEHDPTAGVWQYRLRLEAE